MVIKSINNINKKEEKRFKISYTDVYKKNKSLVIISFLSILFVSLIIILASSLENPENASDYSNISNSSDINSQNISINNSNPIINSTDLTNSTENNTEILTTSEITTQNSQISSQSTPGNIDACQILDTAGVYTLTANVNSTGTCFTVTSENITLDGNSFNITYGTNGTINQYGVYVNGSNNITIKNANIYEGNFAGAGKYAVYLISSNYSTIQNNNITTNNTAGNGIYLEKSDSDIVNYNTITSSGTGITFQVTSNSNITSNTISSYVSGISLAGIHPDNSNSNNIISNTIISKGTGISISPGSTDTVNSNTISSNIINSSGTGISLTSTLTSLVSLNNITTNLTGIGISLTGISVAASNDNNITSNIITTTGTGVGISLGSSAASTYNTTVYSNKVSTNGTNGYGIYIQAAAGYATNSNNITLNTIFTNGGAGYGIYVSAQTGSTAYSNIINSNNITTNGTNSYGIYLTNGAASTVRYTILDSNIITIIGTGYGINSGTSGVTLSNMISNTITTNNGQGISLTSSSSSNIISNIITTNGTSGYGIKISGSSTSNISLNNITTIGTTGYGIYSDGISSSNKIISNSIITNGTSASGIYFSSTSSGPSSNNITSNIITTNGTSASGIYLIGTSTTLSRHNIESNIITTTGTGTGIYLYAYCRLVTITSNILNIANGDRFIIGSFSPNNTLTNNSIINRNYSYYDINISSASVNETFLIDQYLENYSFTGIGGIINVKDSNYGEIDFINPVNGTGNNFSNDIRIGNNFVYVNSEQTGLNQSADIILYNLPGFLAPSIYYNGNIICNSTTTPSCSNFTSLNEINVSFNVSSWSNYSIASDSVFPTVNITYPLNITYNINVSAINYTYSDLNPGNCWYSNNNGETNSSSALTGINFTGITSTEGTNTWTLWCNDSGANINSSSITFFKDTVYALINFTARTPDNNTARKTEFTANITITELNLANITWNWNGTTTIFNTSGSNLTSANNISIINITNPTSTQWIVLFNQSGLIYGSVYVYNVTAVDLAGNSNSTETRTIKASIAPSYVSINTTPLINNYDNLDPGLNVTITANLSDTDNNFDMAILQWKNSTSGADWNNVTMENLTAKGIYTLLNASFTLPNYESNITFRIWSNDTTGESSNSTTDIILSFWDCTWNLTTNNINSPYTFGTVAGYSQNKMIGNITIINTGDPQYSNNCSIVYRVSHNLGGGRIYFNNSATNPSAYTIAAKENKTIIINASYSESSTIITESLSIVVEDIFYRSILTSLNATGTLLTSQSGPYLVQNIVNNYPAVVYLTPGNFSLTGILYNAMGDNLIANTNNTAYNVSFYWIIPNKFTNTSGDYNLTYGNISDTDYHYNSLNISFVDLTSMSSTIETFSLYSYGYNLSGDSITDINNNSLLSNKINITFLCYNATDGICVSSCGYLSDSDCPAPETTSVTTTTGGSGGGGGSAAIGIKQEKSEANFELLSGEHQEFKLKIENKLSNTKENINIKVTGINSEYIQIIPDKIARILPNSYQEITVKITAPAYFTGGKYNLIFEINGDLTTNSSRNKFTENKYVTLTIVEVNRKEVEKMIKDAEVMINKMNLSEMNTKISLQILDEMNNYYKNIDFLNVKNSYKKLKDIYDSAFKSLEIINDLKNKIKSAENNGISVIETKKILYTSESSFKRGDFALALKNLEQAKLTYAIETKGEFNLLYLIKNNPLQTMFVLVMIGAFSLGSSIVLRYRYFKKRLKYLTEEEKLLLELMKVIQRECFEKNKMSMEEYREAMSQYEEKLGRVIEEKISIETKIANLLKLKGKRLALNQERSRIVELLKDLQYQYLNKASIETRVYENTLKTYSRRLSEVEEQLTFLDAQDALKSGGFFRRK